MGPLGNGFPTGFEGNGIPGRRGHRDSANAGTGETSFTADKKIVLGYRDEQYLTEELNACGDVYIATEDGSAGTKGNVLDAIRENGPRSDVICACGPTPMLRALKEYAAAEKHPLLSFSGRADGLWDRSLSGLRLPVQRKWTATAMSAISVSARTVRYSWQRRWNYENTKVTIAGVELKNPVMTASGTFGSGEEYSEFVDLNQLGAVVTKGVANVPWEGNPTPRIAETGQRYAQCHRTAESRGGCIL